MLIVFVRAMNKELSNVTHDPSTMPAGCAATETVLDDVKLTATETAVSLAAKIKSGSPYASATLVSSVMWR